MFDELDEGFEQADAAGSVYYELIVGLVKAISQFHFKSPQLGLHPIFFLRADIFDRLIYGNKNKLRGGIRRLQWTRDRIIKIINFRLARAWNKSVSSEDAPSFISMMEDFFDLKDLNPMV